MTIISTVRNVGALPDLVTANDPYVITLSGGYRHVQGSGLTALQLSNGALVTNDGQVSASHYAIYMSHPSRVVNRGGISGGVNGLLADAGSTIENNSFGTISGNEAGIYFRLSALSQAPQTCTVKNSGVIGGVNAILVNPVAATFGIISIENSGRLRTTVTLDGTAVKIWGISVSIKNSGVIDGIVDMYSTIGTTVASVFTNSGTVNGNVYLAGSSTTTDHGSVKYVGTGSGVVKGIVYGSLYDDHMTGASKKDFFWGHAGNDTLIGGGGGDKLLSGAGNDRLIGGMGADTLAGGVGADEFYYSAARESSSAGGIDRLEAFGAGDFINLRALEGRGRFIGTREFSDTGRFEARVTVLSGTYKLQVDLNGDGRADMIISVIGTNRPTADDFLL